MQTKDREHSQHITSSRKDDMTTARRDKRDRERNRDRDGDHDKRCPCPRPQPHCPRDDHQPQPKQQSCCNVLLTQWGSYYNQVGDILVDAALHINALVDVPPLLPQEEPNDTLRAAALAERDARVEVLYSLITSPVDGINAVVENAYQQAIACNNNGNKTCCIGLANAIASAALGAARSAATFVVSETSEVFATDTFVTVEGFNEAGYEEQVQQGLINLRALILEPLHRALTVMFAAVGCSYQQPIAEQRSSK